MRDANGTGNIYFDVLFVNGIPAISLAFYVFNLIISLINVIWVPIFFYLTCLGYNGYHKNLRLVFSSLYIAFFLLAFGNLFYSILILSRVSDIKYDQYFVIFRFVASLGPGIWRTTFVSIVLERTIATVFCRSYEKKGPLIVGIFLFFIGQLGALMPIIYFIVRVHFLVSIIFVFSNDITCVIALFVLFWSNKSVRKLKFNTTIELTQRYQITENLKVVLIMTPVIAIGTIFDIIAISLYSIQTIIDFNTQLLYPMYLLIPNIYVAIAFLLYIKSDKKIRRKFFGCCCKPPAVVPIRSELLDFEGKPLILNDNPDIRFIHLNQTWNEK